MNHPISVYLRCAKDYNASIHYRQLAPLRAMSRMQLPMAASLHWTDANYTPQQVWQLMVSSDINFMYQSVGDVLDYLKYTRTLPPVEIEGTLKFPPTFIFDSDDDIFNVDPLNPSFSELGCKDHTGKDLEDGERIWIRHQTTNKPMLLWKDGDNVDYSRNRTVLDHWRQVLKEGDLITVSTPRLKARIAEEIGGQEDKIHVIPNCIDLGDFPQIPLAYDPKTIRILWQGSTTHWAELYELAPSLAKICEKHPEARFIFWGGDWQALQSARLLPREVVEHIEWVDYRAYKTRLATIGHDINLCPLNKIKFNETRSSIKHNESSALLKPAATLAANFGPYQDELIEGETALLYNDMDEFETKLSGLIEDSKLRQTLGANSKDWIRTNRDPSLWAMKQFDLWVQAFEKRKLMPLPSRAERRRAAKRLQSGLTVPEQQLNVRRGKDSSSGRKRAKRRQRRATSGGK